MRRAPEGGYDFAHKRDYRRKVWATFRNSLKADRIPVAESHALLMPSLEGDEIEVALNAGFREEHLHVVDMSPAIVATLRRRYPKIHTYGVTASRAIERIARSGLTIRCANLDFCNKVSRSFVMELLTIAVHGNLNARFSISTTGQISLTPIGPHGAFAPISYVAVSTLRGREERQTINAWKGNPATDDRLDLGVSLLLDRVDCDSSECAAARLAPILKIVKALAPFDRRRLLSVYDIVTMNALRKLDERLRPGVIATRAEAYKSSNGQTMLWSLWRIVSGPQMTAGFIIANMARKANGMREHDGLGQFLLPPEGLPDYASLAIWKETLPILRAMLQKTSPSCRFSDKDLSDIAELQMGLTVERVKALSDSVAS